MSRNSAGTFSLPPGTAAIPGGIVASDAYNTANSDIANALTESARVAELRDLGGTNVTTGTSSAYVLTLGAPQDTTAELTAGYTFGFQAHVANAGACTLKRNGTTKAYPLRAVSGQDLAASDIKLGGRYVVSFDPASFSKAASISLTNGLSQATLSGSMAGVAIGQSITVNVAGLPIGTTITGVAGNVLTMSAPFTGTTGSATATITGGEFLLLNGALLSTATLLAQANGLPIVSVVGATAFDAALRGKYARANGTLQLLFDTTTSLASGWFSYLHNIGTGDVTVKVPTIASSTGTLTAGSTSVTGVASTAGMAPGQYFQTASSSVITTTGNMAANANVITSVPSTAGMQIGDLVASGATGFPVQAYIIGLTSTTITLSASIGATPATGASISVSAAGIVEPTTIASIVGSTITLSSPWYGPTTASAAFTTTSDAVDALSSYIVYPGEARLFTCDGAGNVRSLILQPFSKAYTASGSFKIPPGYARFGGFNWAGGATGANNGGAGRATGGGGGACVPLLGAVSLFGRVGASIPVVVAASTPGVTAGLQGSQGGNSYLGRLGSFGGGGGVTGASNNGGSGGGALSAGQSGTGALVSGGRPFAGVAGDGDFGGASATGAAMYGGGGGGTGTGTALPSRDSYYGGGGSGGTDTKDEPGGRSFFGGRGGAGSTSGSGEDGQAPGGAGGATQSGTLSGAGARGEIRLWGEP